MGDREWGLGSVAGFMGSHQSRDELSCLDAEFEQVVLFCLGNKGVVQQQVCHGANLTTGTSGVIVRLSFLRDVKGLPSLGQIVHDGNSGSLELIAKPIVLGKRGTPSETIHRIRE
jgi:hypothetical protein